MFSNWYGLKGVRGSTVEGVRASSVEGILGVPLLVEVVPMGQERLSMCNCYHSNIHGCGVGGAYTHWGNGKAHGYISQL